MGTEEDRDDHEQREQQTRTGFTIPVPSRDDIEDALQRMAQPAKPEPSRRRRRRRRPKQQ